MNTYEVECVDRETGDSQMLEFKADSPEEAKSMAARSGYIVGAAHARELHLSSPKQMGDAELLIRFLSSKKFRRQRQWDTGIGVVLGMILWAVLVFVAWFVVTVLIVANAPRY